ncbi:3-dehydro-bile acid delta(4,6)-reductase [Ralstonia condita]|uniref:HI0933 family protein n=3 Tax=Ralstonia TaxID=48736 RepID=C6BLA2_RALP1|nr:TIGR03862 family flavoprotein [Ralstonia sp. LMG 7141]MDE2202838.1 TIGR03862 family flavoprotein [Burkholderiaceae bacterium]CAJ0784956.1 3-dehydro-bile acid delta(4,6)-reductase [Ralstonia sp. LMG 7141]
MSEPRNAPVVAVIGAGPAGLMAAEVLSRNGVRVEVFDAMPSAGRKFLLAGIGGMNITHAEPIDAFLGRYRTRRDALAPLIEHFSPDALRAWIHGLGIETFVGSSGRVFPTEMKAAPLLRAWLHRLREAGVKLHMRHRWIGWGDAQNASALRFETPDGERYMQADAVVLAMGGASWPRLGSNGAWVPLLEARGVQVAPLQPANCGFDASWSAHFQERFAGQPVKSVAIALPSAEGGPLQFRQGECVVTQTGIEGSLIYALSAPIRDALAAAGTVTVWLDLAPGWSAQRVATELMRPRGARSMSSHLQSKLNITGVKLGLLRECLSKEAFADLAQLARAIKALPLTLLRPRPIDEAISTAGGVAFEALDARLMIERLPGVFCAGEMLDWEAPTGGYLLTACFASGAAAGQGVLDYLGQQGISVP